ncbi:hypothetical protein QEN19_002487 [Hanseniaspora menglaensis]
MSRFYSEPISNKTVEIIDEETPRISKKFEEVCGKQKLTNEIITTRSPEVLEQWFAAQRTKFASFLQKGEKRIEEATNTHQSYEKKFLQTYVDPIIDPAKKEDFAVGSGTIIIGFLSGLIINRNIKQLRYIKPIMPITLALIAFRFSLPETFKSFTDVSYKVESNFVSAGVLEKQAALVNDVKASKESINNTLVTIEQSIEKETTKAQNGINKVLRFFS